MQDTIAAIKPLDAAMLARAWARLDDLTKPRRSLGLLEDLAARYVAIRGQPRARIGGKRVCVFAGDHHVTQEGVSAYPSAVTGLMVRNFLGGGAAINVLARQAGADVQVVDVGVAEDLGPLPGLERRNVKRGAANIARGPAMTLDEARRAIAVGIDCANAAAKAGVTVIATGEMGIGNTTPASALFALYLGQPVKDMVGPGTGLAAAAVARKVAVIERAVNLNWSQCTDPLATLAALGGLEIAGIAGFCLGGAANRQAVMVDGFIASAGALAALRLCPAVKDYLFFSHQSAEPGHRLFFRQEGLRPMLDLGMRLGEGTGAAIAMQILTDAVAVYNEMATFADIGITPGA